MKAIRKKKKKRNKNACSVTNLDELNTTKADHSQERTVREHRGVAVCLTCLFLRESVAISQRGQRRLTKKNTQRQDEPNVDESRRARSGPQPPLAPLAPHPRAQM